MNASQSPPVLVLGGGPVGQTTALLLARWAVPVVLLDQRPRRDPVGSKAICQQRDVLDVWNAVGAGRRIADEGVTWTTARTFYRDRELFGYSFQERGSPAFPPFVNLSQARTEEILDERIAAEPLIDVRWDHRVTGIEQDGAGVRLRCDTPEGTATVEGCWAVACAGARGDAVRRMLGVEFAGRSFDDRFLICDIRTDLPDWAEERRFYFDPAWNPGRQVLIHPCPDSTFRIDWQVPAGYDLDAEEACGALDERIRAIIGERPYEIVWKSVYRFHSRLVDRMRAGRVLLAGDCAHLVSPFGARGLNSGVQDAENAAWKIAFVVHGWAGERLLDSYHDERHAAAVENLEVTGTTMRFLVPGDEQERQRRTAILERAAHDRTAWAEVDSGRLSEPYWYARSPLTTPSAARPPACRPERGRTPRPGPGVLVPDAPVSVPGRGTTRFRELARDGVLLLACGGVDQTEVRAAATGIAAPVRCLDLAAIDRAGALGEALSAGPGELWVIRPDAHVAAVLTHPDRTAVLCALRKLLAASPAQPMRSGAERPASTS
ncbi:pentachlorophenol monooxygenase/3-(3-hydroxy-phenyl)propionate hydroxylase [Saccharopolyspora erythraea NRRL 2338]|uniref:Pentachlorophenol monooxygenase n=3 Tax=Saccharopolyspora erythraea TaxID=1836 RepID=A4FE60_SACEN|nr:FAD-dependent monooxygenase [Saccharopolyspora erythraea]PFG96063.1 pentachlorophenol monooxygenase/3-(3-hydroxy-phenyl)propionate hydroxylase [Saccharopolyspora erythraea NRRL 2338]QRK92609.1 FAD-dependent monooxygenase [Saccharopolyspora erythraea]CAM02335.1 pentachlorophenol monooxygenase [Saccharopolyspora erythraea NRRL 2338]